MTFGFACGGTAARAGVAVVVREATAGVVLVADDRASAAAVVELGAEAAALDGVTSSGWVADAAAVAGAASAVVVASGVIV